MSAYEGSYKSLLQGVSQQIPRERLPGQVSAQDNMLSDVVTMPRRRPGLEYRGHAIQTPTLTKNFKAWYTEIGKTKVHVLLNTGIGRLILLDEKYAHLGFIDSDYLIGNVENIVNTTLGDELFFLNTAKKPVMVGGSETAKPAGRDGFMYIRAGAFSKRYVLSVAWAGMGHKWEVEYTTPDGSQAGDAAKATPEYIAQILTDRLYAAANIYLEVYRDGTYCYYKHKNPDAVLSVTSPSGAGYIIVSNDSYLRNEGDMPAKLPAEANGMVIRVGSITSPTYYVYNSGRQVWLESGDLASPTALSNMPISLVRDITTPSGFKFDDSPFEGRLSGDEDSNPNPTFLKVGLSGIGTYQGRLVLLSGNMVYMSASLKPRRFYRSTVTQLKDSDPIGVGAAGNSSAAYRYAIPFQKDLMLFSEKYQALIPSGNVAITPRTANVVLTSSYDADMTAPPVPMGRTLMYAAPRSEDFFGMLEMLPSTFVDGQYTSTDATAHLPKYMPGRCRFSVSSSVAGLSLFAPSRDLKSLIVHEYIWDGDKKVQQSWHTWRFRYEVAAAYFSGQVVNIVFVRNHCIVIASVDPRVGVLTFADARRPFLDMYWNSEVRPDGSVDIPYWLTIFDPDSLKDLVLSRSKGPRAGELVGSEPTGPGGAPIAVRSQRNGDVAVGFSYRSSFSPTPPMMTDQNGVVIGTNKLTVQRFLLSTVNSSQYKVTVRDAGADDDSTSDMGTLYYSSSDLQLGRSQYANTSVGVVPCRTNADTTTIVMHTDGTGELNLAGLEYIAKFNQRVRRR